MDSAAAIQADRRYELLQYEYRVSCTNECIATAIFNGIVFYLFKIVLNFFSCFKLFCLAFWRRKKKRCFCIACAVSHSVSIHFCIHFCAHFHVYSIASVFIEICCVVFLNEHQFFCFLFLWIILAATFEVKEFYLSDIQRDFKEEKVVH